MNLSLAGLASVFPVRSLARTLNRCLPGRSLYRLGEAQSFHALSSRLHSNVESTSEASNTNFTFAFAVPVSSLFFGRLVILVSGGAS